MNHTIYINGVLHRRTAFNCTHRGETFWADSPEFPGVRCSQHSLGLGAEEHLAKGGGVTSSGNSYTRWEPKHTKIARLLKTCAGVQDLEGMIEDGEITASEALRHLQTKIKCSDIHSEAAREREFERKL